MTIWIGLATVVSTTVTVVLNIPTPVRITSCPQNFRIISDVTQEFTDGQTPHIIASRGAPSTPNNQTGFY